MGKWKTYLKSNVMDWLLEEENPSVRYFTLKDLLNKSDVDEEVIKSKQDIMNSGIIEKILNRQLKGGYWGILEDFYVSSKYKGTVWTILLLAELGADGNDKRIKNACEFILQYSQDIESGAFAYRGNKKGNGDHYKVLSCLTGNMLFSLIRFGYLDDPRIQKGINWIIKYQRYDDGIEEAPNGWPYNVGSKKGEACWGKHTCHMGIVKSLKALAEVPLSKRSVRIKDTINKAAEYMLTHHIYKQSHNLDIIAKQEWTRFGFPLMWKIDTLEVLDILTKIGFRDERMKEAIDLVVSKQNENGRWILEKTFYGRMQVNIEQKGKESKWITLFALRVLKRLYS